MPGSKPKQRVAHNRVDDRVALQIWKLRGKGQNFRSIATEVGVGISTVSRVLSRPKPKRPKKTLEETIRALLEKGKNVRDVAEETGATRGQVGAVLAKMKAVDEPELSTEEPVVEKQPRLLTPAFFYDEDVADSFMDSVL